MKERILNYKFSDQCEKMRCIHEVKLSKKAPIRHLRECPYCHGRVIADITYDKSGMDAVCECGNHIWISKIENPTFTEHELQAINSLICYCEYGFPDINDPKEQICLEHVRDKIVEYNRRKTGMLNDVLRGCIN